MTTDRPLHLNVAAILAGTLDPRLTIPADAPIAELSDLDRELCQAAHRFNANVTSADSWANPWSFDRAGRQGLRPRLLASIASPPCHAITVSVDAKECLVRLQTGTTGLLPFGFRSSVSAEGAISCTLDWDRRTRRLHPELGRSLCATPYFPATAAALLEAAGPEPALAGMDAFTQAFVCVLQIGLLETELGRNPLVPDRHRPTIIDRAASVENALADWHARLQALTIPELSPATSAGQAR